MPGLRRLLQFLKGSSAGTLDEHKIIYDILSAAPVILKLYTAL